MHFPRFLRHVNRRFTNPMLGTVAWIVPPLAVVHHVGRKSGRTYRTPVVAFPTENGFIVPMTYGRDVDWARNLIRARGGEIQQLGRRHRLRNPRIVDGAVAYQHLPAVVRPALRAANFPGYVLLDRGEASRREAGSPRRRTSKGRR